MRRRILWSLIAVAVLGAALWAVLSQHHGSETRFDWTAWTPRDADAVLWLDRPGDLRAGLSRLAHDVPGTQGVRDALRLVAGADLLDPQAVAKAGLREDAGLVAFRWHDAVWLALPVRDERGPEHVLSVLRQRGYRPVAQGSSAWSIGDRTQPDSEALHAWLLDDVLLLRTGGAAEKAETALAAFQQEPRMAAAAPRPGELHARATLAAVDRQAMHDLLGPGNLLIGGAIDRLTGLVADLRVADGVPDLHVRMTAPAGALADVAQYHSGFLREAPGGLLDVGDLLPDETPLLVRARLNPALLSLLPAQVRASVLPSAALQVVHPALVGVDANLQVVQPWDGQVAVALLGIDDAVPLDPRAWPALSWRTALRLAVVLSLRTDQDAASLLQRVRAALDTTADRPKQVQLGVWAGLSVPGPEAPWLLLQSGRRIAFVSGTGELEDLQRVADGKFPSLAKVMRGDLEREVVEGRRLWFGALVTTPRLVRSLRRRGMPDYVVQMLGSVAAIAAGVALESDAIDLRAVLRPTRQAGPQVAP